jgi:hypothetical protein
VSVSPWPSITSRTVSYADGREARSYWNIRRSLKRDTISGSIALTRLAKRRISVHASWILPFSGIR